MQLITALFCICLVIHKVTAPPPRRDHKQPEHEPEKDDDAGLEGLGIEYERYLREVIDVLDSDPEFKKKLQAAEETDIRTGKIAHELEYVDHRVRTKLDEVKRQELERLRHLAQKQFEISNNIDVEHLKIAPPEHLDHENPHTFEIEDLKKLIYKVTSDLNEADKKRRDEFKEYEMQKEFEKNQKLEHLEGDDKIAYEKEVKDNETKHKQHETLHHPGSKQQLEEVWEKQDHLGDQEFNPKVFFQLHGKKVINRISDYFRNLWSQIKALKGIGKNIIVLKEAATDLNSSMFQRFYESLTDLDGNGHWDQDEVKALFVKELDKMYQAGVPEDDMRERAEEMERMREHVFKESDRNGDHLISYEEFLEQAKKPEFEKDDGWQSIDQQQPVYSPQEYAEYEKWRLQEVQRMVQQGLIPPQPVYNSPYHHSQGQASPHHPNAQYGQQHHPGYAAHPNQFQQQPGQLHPAQAQGQPHPNQFQGQAHHVPDQQRLNNVPPGQLHPSQISQGHPPQQFGNAPQGHPPQQFGNVPQGHPQQQFGNVPQGHHQPQAGQLAQGYPQQQLGQAPQNQQQNIGQASSHQIPSQNSPQVDSNDIPRQQGFQNAPPSQQNMGGQPQPLAGGQQPQGQYQGHPAANIQQAPNQGQPNRQSNEIPVSNKLNPAAPQNLHPNDLGSHTKL